MIDESVFGEFTPLVVVSLRVLSVALEPNGVGLESRHLMGDARGQCFLPCGVSSGHRMAESAKGLGAQVQQVDNAHAVVGLQRRCQLLLLCVGQSEHILDHMLEWCEG